MKRLGICLVAIILLARGEVPAAQFYSFGDLPGRGHLGVSDVSADGRVVVGTVIHDQAVEKIGPQAFRWSIDDGLAVLEEDRSGAFGVSADGSIVAGTVSTDLGPRAYRWTTDAGTDELGALRGASIALDVSDDGTVIVGSGGTEPPNNSEQAVRRTAQGGWEGLGDLDGGLFLSQARAVSSDGTTIVGHGNTERGIEAFRWTEANGMQGLGHLSGTMNTSTQELSSVAVSASADGSVIVGRSSVGESQAFRWTQETGMVALIGPGDLITRSGAMDVSADGAVIVGLAMEGTDLDFYQYAFIWDETHGLRNLEVVLSQDFGLDLSGWNLYSAEAVSADGRTIVGSGTNPHGEHESWVAVIPEPSSKVTMTIAAACMLCALRFGTTLPRRQIRFHSRSSVPQGRP